jgi:hypothetical protein
MDVRSESRSSARRPAGPGWAMLRARSVVSSTGGDDAHREE